MLIYKESWLSKKVDRGRKSIEEESQLRKKVDQQRKLINKESWMIKIVNLLIYLGFGVRNWKKETLESVKDVYSSAKTVQNWFMQLRRKIVIICLF